MNKARISVTLDQSLVLSIMETGSQTSTFINEGLKFILENSRVKEHILKILEVKEGEKQKTRISGFQRHTDNETMPRPTTRPVETGVETESSPEELLKVADTKPTPKSKSNPRLKKGDG